MPNKRRQLSEAAAKHWERLDATIHQRFIGSNMSNTKWVKLLRAAALLSNVVPRMNFKLVQDPNVQTSYTPPYPESVEEEWFREPFIYKEVEWVEFPFTYEVARGSGLAPTIKQQDIASLKQHLESTAQFPIHLTESGLRVVAYAEV